MKKLLYVLALLPTPVLAQGVVKTTPNITAAQQTADAAKAKADAAQAAVDAVIASIPKPATAMPNMESTTPSTGASTRYLREDYVPVRITRAKKVTTDALGNWTVTWKTPLPADPVTLPVPMNTAGAQTITCNVTSSTTTGSTGYCTQTRALPQTLTLLTALVGYAITQLAPTGTVVQVFALPTTD